MNMSNTNVEICRLCLKPIYDKNFDAIDDISRKMLNVLLLNLNLDISKDPVMCYECATVLQNCFDFKSACVSLETRPSIKSEVIDSLTLDEPHLKKENMELSDTSGYQKACLFCLKQNQLGLLTALNESKGTMFMVNVVQKHIPEMNIRITQEILTCEICIDSIKNLFNFVTRCMDVEEKIQTYITIEGAGDRSYTELHKIQQFTSPIINYEINCADMNKSKTEDSYNYIDQDVTVKTEIKIEDVTDINEQEFNVDEDLKIESHQINCRRNLEATTLLSYPHEEEYEADISVSASAKEFMCEMCSFTTREEQSFNNHMLMHDKEVECELCPYKGNKGNLRKHMLCHKNSMEVKMYTCDTCGFQSKYNSVVKKHSLIHKASTEIAMFKCDICYYEAKRKDSLKVHMLTHRNPSEITIYKCNICGQGVKYKRSLIKHMLTHKDISEITVYKCEVCTYQTKYKSDLKKHVNTMHNGPQPIQ